jgi:glyoxylase-like metal-dependent hydrolase (beta-lactamase superfamily II)
LLPATHTNAYALGSRDVLLVEPATPYEDEQREWLAWAEGLRSAGRRLVALFATHHHIDHVGGAEALSRALGLPVWAHAITAERLDVAVERRLVEGDAIELDGPVPQRWNVFHTPGHAAGHLCLLEAESRTAIVGDMVASEGTILIPPDDGGDMGEYLRQLVRMGEWGARVALPAHGEPIDDPDALFARYVAHRLMRERFVTEALSAFGAAGATVDELVPKAYADAPPSIWPIAMLSLRAHLAKLVSDGVVRERDGRYTMAVAS